MALEIPQFSNAKEWAKFLTERSRPFFLFVLKKTWKTIMVCFVITFFALFLYHPKQYSKEYALIPLLKKESKLNIHDLPAWNELLYEFLKSYPLFHKSAFDTINYDVSKTQYRTNIRLFYNDGHSEAAMKTVINTAIKTYLSFVSQDIIIRSVPQEVSFNRNGLFYAIFFPLLLAIVLFFIFSIGYALSDEIYDLNGLRSEGFRFLGVLPHCENFQKGVTKSAYWEDVWQLYGTIMNKKIKRLKVILFSSAYSGEGKSVSSINLAKAAVHFGKKVILVECDMRKSSFNRYMGLPVNKGLGHYLIGEAEIADIVMASDSDPGISIITAGMHPRHPTELFETDRFKNLISNLKAHYDLVIIDAPPTLVSDALFIARFSDLIIVIARFYYSRFKETKIAYRKLSEVNENIYLLANQAPSAFGYAFGYGYGYGGYYQSNGE